MVSLVALWTALTLGVALAGMTGGLALMALLMLLGSRRWPWSRGISRDLLPFACILLPLLLVNTVPWFRELTTTAGSLR